MSKGKKILMWAIIIVAVAILVLAVFIVKEPQEAPNVFGAIADGTTSKCVRGGYTWNYFGGTVIADSINLKEATYENENKLLVKPGEQITFSNSGLDLTSHRFYTEEVKYYDENNNEVPVPIDENDIYQDLRHFTLEAPEENGTYLYIMKLNYHSKGIAEYGLKVVVSSDPTYAINELIKYKDTYIGDAPNVSAILNKLPYSKYKDGIVLRTSKEPYELIVRYKGISLEKAILQNNSIALLTLIPNLEVITYSIQDDEKTIVYTRDEVEALMGREMSDYAENTDLWLQEVFFKEQTQQKGRVADLYKIVILDAMSGINGITNEYIAIDMESFSSINELTGIEKKQILDSAASNFQTILDTSYEELKTQGMYKKGLKGTLIRLKSAEKIDEITSLILEEIKSDSDIKKVVYDASIKDGEWTLIKK